MIDESLTGSHDATSQAEAAPEGETTPQAETTPQDQAARQAETASGADLEAQLEEERALKERYLAGWQRAQADLENLKKQVARDLAFARVAMTEAFVRGMLPALDSLERACKHAREMRADEAICQGLELVMRKFLDFLASEGVEPIAAQGQAFDPRRHEAILRVPVDGVAEGTIVDEVQKGYATRERVIRPALVVVASKAESAASPEAEDAATDE